MIATANVLALKPATEVDPNVAGVCIAPPKKVQPLSRTMQTVARRMAQACV